MFTAEMLRTLLKSRQKLRFVVSRACSTASPLTLERLDGAEKDKFDALICRLLWVSGISIIHLHKPDTKNAISKLMLEKVRP